MTNLFKVKRYHKENGVFILLLKDFSKTCKLMYIIRRNKNQKLLRNIEILKLKCYYKKKRMM